MTRRCCYCEIEFGIVTNSKDRVSHGVCRRHLVQQYKENDLEEAIPKVELAPEEEFCADMSQVFDG